MQEFRHKKSLGQHFLKAPEIIDAIAELLPVKNKKVLEIGAGEGDLTQALAEAGAKVTALEIDPELVAILQKKFSKNESVEVVEADALEFGFSPYPLIFGNLPYNLSTPILLKTLSSPFQHAVFMLQAEFGERLIAQPGSKDWSKLSVVFQSRAKAEVVEWVSRECFHPIPEVDSVLLHITPKKKSEVTNLDDQLVSALFQHPNQNLRKALKHSRHLLGEEKVEKLVGKIPPELLGKSAKKLSLEEFARLSSLSRH